MFGIAGSKNDCFEDDEDEELEALRLEAEADEDEELEPWRLGVEKELELLFCGASSSFFFAKYLIGKRISNRS